MKTHHLEGPGDTVARTMLDQPDQPYQSYERDERWSAVDQYATHHLDQSNKYSAALRYAKDISTAEGLPNIEVSLQQGKFLATQCQLINAKHVLEVGTLGAYSTIWLASTSPDVKVTTIEIDVKHKEVAERVVRNAGLENQIEILLGAGVDVLPKLRAEIEAGKRHQFDFTFIDADKPNNLNYLHEAVLMSRSRACIIVDNVVRKGAVADAEAAKLDANVRGSREVIEAAGNDPRILQSALLQTVGEKNYDGFLMVVVK